MKNNLLTLLIILSSIFLFFKLLFSLKRKVTLIYIFTPLTIFTVFIIGLCGLFFNHDIYAFLICAGLAAAIIGDIFNINEESVDGRFKTGVLFFIICQIFYSAAFITGIEITFKNISYAFGLLFFINLLLKFLSLKIKSLFLKIEIYIYISVITISLLFAFGNFINDLNEKNFLSFSGMVLFVLSDLALSINLFVKRFRYYYLLVWTLYAPAQILIALSACY